MSAKSKLYTMAMMGAMLSSMAQTSEREYYDKEPNIEPKKPIIPNGCKEYHFTRSGRFDTTENMWNDIDYIFNRFFAKHSDVIHNTTEVLRLNIYYFIYFY